MHIIYLCISFPNLQVQVWDGAAGVLMDTFRQHTADVLNLAASADGSQVFAAGVEARLFVCKYPTPTEENESNFPVFLKDLPAPLCGVTMEPQHQDKLMLYGQGYCVYVDLSRPLVAAMKTKLALDSTTKLMKSSLLKKRKNKPSPDDPAGKKRERDGQDGSENEDNAQPTDTALEESNFVVFNKYRNLLHVGFILNNQMVRITM